MAVIFTPSGQSAITIGGTTLTGPFPKYSVRRDFTYSDDGTPVSDRYSITVTGQVIAEGDITVSGERQDSLHEKIIEKVKNTAITTSSTYGRLEIVPYGGLANSLDFLDARLVGIEASEQDDESSGTQTQSYSFSFEATIFNGQEIFTYKLARTDESWEISENDAQYTLSTNDLSTGTPEKTYTLTHTLSAVGLKKFDSGPTLNTDGAAWKQAQLWVNSRLQASPTTITTDVNGNLSTSFNPDYFSSDSGGPVDITAYSFYNRVRTVSTDILGGSYSVTDTFFASKDSARHEVETTVDSGEDGVVSINISGSVIGLSSQSFAATTHDKYANALAEYNLIAPTIFTLANLVYTDSGISGTLRSLARTSSVGHNKLAGVITYQYSYDDKLQTIPNALSNSILIRDTNEDRSHNIIAIINIIGKADGPIFQNMETTSERRRSVELTAVMAKGYRTAKPDGMSYILTYKPAGSTQEPKVETWQPDTGAYSLNVEWVY